MNSTIKMTAMAGAILIGFTACAQKKEKRIAKKGDDVYRVEALSEGDSLDPKSDLADLVDLYKSSYDTLDTVSMVSYAYGQALATNMKMQGFETVDLSAFSLGVIDALQNRTPEMTVEQGQQLLNSYMQGLMQAKAAAAKAEGDAWLAENAKKEGVKTTESGLQYKVIKDTDGMKPKPTSKVTVHYHGTLRDGEVFDSSVERGQPATFPLNQVIPGWTEGLQLMSPGSKYVFYIPSDLGYGPRGAGGGAIGPNEVLIFEVELLSINED